MVEALTSSAHLQTAGPAGDSGTGVGILKNRVPSANPPVKLGLFFFSDDESHLDAGDKYGLLLECARLADRHGLHAVWIPERHFNPVGGLYPNPSVLAAALAVLTHRIRIRAGSVVLPLHNVVRVAEEWSVVDNLSQGRVDLALASGWDPDDFTLTSPDHYHRRRDLLFESLATLRELWRGEPIHSVRGNVRTAGLTVHPSPIQKHLNCWISTSSKSPDTWGRAAETGENILTALLLQSPGDLARQIRDYHGALRRHGFDPRTREVTLMLHTFVGDDDAAVRHLVKPALLEYLRNHIDHYGGTIEAGSALTDGDKATLAEHSFDRYCEGSGLLGSMDTCERMIRRMESLGVTEIACLIDFGLDRERVLEGVRKLGALNARLH